MWVLPLKHESLVHTYIECPCHIEIILVSQDRPNHPHLELLSLSHTVYTRQLLIKWLQGLACFPFRHLKHNWYLTQDVCCGVNRLIDSSRVYLVILDLQSDWLRDNCDVAHRNLLNVTWSFSIHDAESDPNWDWLVGIAYETVFNIIGAYLANHPNTYNLCSMAEAKVWARQLPSPKQHSSAYLVTILYMQ